MQRRRLREGRRLARERNGVEDKVEEWKETSKEGVKWTEKI